MYDFTFSYATFAVKKIENIFFLTRARNQAAKLGSKENLYKVSMRIRGRSFVKDDHGEWHEIDENGHLIPDEKVKPL